jgi:hypothetical protein
VWCVRCVSPCSQIISHLFLLPEICRKNRINNLSPNSDYKDRLEALTAPPEKMAAFWVVAPRTLTLIALMMEAVQTSETSVYSYKSTRRYNPEDGHHRCHRRENLKSYFLQLRYHFTVTWPVVNTGACQINYFSFRSSFDVLELFVQILDLWRRFGGTWCLF